MAEPWRNWEKRPDIDGSLANRARGVLPEMESTKQLVELVSEVYRPEQRVLDVGCNAGHYLRGLRRLDPQLEYVGVDAYVHYIDQARRIFAADPHARFEVKDIHDPLFPDDPFDIVFCCNLILHLPDFRRPLHNLLASTRSVCFVRALLGDRTTKVRRALVEELTDDGEPVEFLFQNTWGRQLVLDFAHGLGWNTDLIADRFDPSAIASEYETLKQKDGTRILDGRQVDDVVVYNWEWLKLTRTSESRRSPST
jgi:hypothetical protein